MLNLKVPWFCNRSAFITALYSLLNLICDSVGTLNTPATFFERLRAAGVSLVEFNPINPKDTKRGWKLNNRDHRKLLIIDGKRVFLGGINSSVYWEKQSGGTLPTANYFPALVSQGTAWYTQSEALLILRNRSKQRWSAGGNVRWETRLKEVFIRTWQYWLKLQARLTD